MTTKVFYPKRGSSDADDAPRPIDLAAGRRGFIQSIGLGIAGTALFGAAASGPASAQAAVTDVDIINFALNLEYLEAEFYQRAAYGRGLGAGDIEGTGTLGGVTGGRAVPFSDPNVRAYANEIANDELAHVRALRGLLSNNRVARPAINLDQSFTTAARMAGLIGQGQTFDAFANDANFLLAAFIFEDVGVTAYKGAAPLINNPLYLFAAARVLSVEGYHSGLVRTLLYQGGYFQQTKAISDLRDNLDNVPGQPATDLDQGINEPTAVNIVPSDGDGVAFGRSTTQVLNIVYGNNNKQPGGFFPNGANGTIR